MTNARGVFGGPLGEARYRRASAAPQTSDGIATLRSIRPVKATLTTARDTRDR